MSPTKVIDADLSASAEFAHPLDPPTAFEIDGATQAPRKWQSSNNIASVKFIERIFEVHLIDVLNSSTATHTRAVVAMPPTSPPSSPSPSLPRASNRHSPRRNSAPPKMIRKDPRVIKLNEQVGIKPEHVYAEGWSIGWDTRFGRSRRVQQCLLFVREHKDANLYAHLLDFFPIVDNNTDELLAIDFTDHRTKPNGASFRGTTEPPTEISFEAPDGRERIGPPTLDHDYRTEFTKTSSQGRQRRDHQRRRSRDLRQDFKADPRATVSPSARPRCPSKTRHDGLPARQRPRD
ncbi:hypothetical protein V8E36_003355 [Tilletia maclaganii]